MSMVQKATIETVGYAVFECPDCGGEVRTGFAKSSVVIQTGMRWLGVPCPGCGKTYTVELTEP